MPKKVVKNKYSVTWNREEGLTNTDADFLSIHFKEYKIKIIERSFDLKSWILSGTEEDINNLMKACPNWQISGKIHKQKTIENQ